MPPTSIGLIISSVRQPRICPQIADFVLQTIQNSSAKTQNTTPNIDKIDLETWNLPFNDEPLPAVMIKDPANYTHAHSRAWSAEIAKHDAFVFVSPQYNGGYPAALKNAIDYLFHEWTGKPFMIVTYGGFGGTHCAEQLSSVLGLMSLKPIGKRVALTYPSRQWAGEKAFVGADLGLDATSDESLWAGEREEIREAFGELIKLIEAKESEEGK